MIYELFTDRLWLLLLVQGTACLAAGLAASYALRHRPARAHQVLLTALLAAVLMPTLYLAAGYYGLGLLASKPTAAGSAPATAEASYPWTSDTMGSLGPGEARPGWPRDTRAGRPRHDGATDIRLFPDLPTIEAAAEPALPEVEPVRAIPAPPAATMDVPWSVLAILGWGGTTAILLLRLILRFALGLRLLRVGHPLESEPLRRTVDGARSRLGVVQPVGIRCSERVQSPVIWCWGREPVLLVQEAASNSPEGTDWVGVFCHELAHWRRRDHLSGLFAELLAALLPWHFLLWWAKGRLLKLSEQACDDWVLATGQNGVDYAERLLGLAAERQMAFLPTVIGKEKTMHMRIRRIIQDKGSDPRLGTGWALAVGALALCTTVGVAVAQRRPAGPEPRDAPPAKAFKERREIEVREPPGTEQQRIAMKRVLERLMKQADEKKETLAKGNELPEEERLAQQIELKLLVEQIEQLKNRLEAPGRAPVKIAPKKTSELGLEARMDSLRQAHEELGLSAEKMEREIEEAARDGRDQEVRELKSEQERIRTKRAAVERELDQLKGKKLDELQRAPAEVQREKVVRKPAAGEQDREEKLQYLRLRAEKIAKTLNEDPDMDPRKAEIQKKVLQVIQEQIRALEQEPRGLDGRKEAPDVAPKHRIIKEEVQIEKKPPDGPRRIVKGSAGSPRLEARVYAVEHISPERLRAIVEALLEGPETVTLYANGRKATVIATMENHQRIERVIRIIDVPEEEYMAGGSSDAGRSLRAITPRYFNPQRLQDLLKAVLGQAGDVGLAYGERTAVVATSNANMRRVESILQELDVPMNDRVRPTEVEELRSQMRGLSEQMQQIQKRLDQMAEQDGGGKTDDPADPVQEYKIRY